MKRLMYLTTLSLVATLLLAGVAAAQGVAPTGGTNPYGCPDDAPFVATPPGELGEAGLLCFPTQEQAEIYSQTGVNPSAEETPPAEEPEQYEAEPPVAPEPPAAPDTGTGELPHTGGVSPALLLPAAALLLGAGLVGVRAVRRR